MKTGGLIDSGNCGRYPNVSTLQKFLLWRESPFRTFLKLGVGKVLSFSNSAQQESKNRKGINKGRKPNNGKQIILTKDLKELDEKEKKRSAWGDARWSAR